MGTPWTGGPTEDRNFYISAWMGPLPGAEFKVHFPVIWFNYFVYLIGRQWKTGPEVIFPYFQSLFLRVQSEGKMGQSLVNCGTLFVHWRTHKDTHAHTQAFNFWLSSPPSAFPLHPADHISCQWEQKKSTAWLFLNTNTMCLLHPYVCHCVSCCSCFFLHFSWNFLSFGKQLWLSYDNSSI